MILCTFKILFVQWKNLLMIVCIKFIQFQINWKTIDRSLIHPTRLMAFCDNNIEYEGRQNLLTSHAKLRAIWQNVILPLNQAPISNNDLKFVVTFHKCQCYQLVQFNCLTLQLPLVRFAFFLKCPKLATLKIAPTFK